MFKNQPEILFALVVISIVFAILASLIGILLFLHKKKIVQIKLEKKILAFNYEKMRLKSQIEVQELTYSALGKELHDNVGQLLSTAKMLLGLTERAMDSPPDTLLTANATLGDAINELRSLSKSLDKEWLEQFSFIENLTTEINRINSGKIINCELINPIDLHLESGGQIILFRIVQEAIQNAIKHANPKNILIRITNQDTKINITIQDDGVGFIQNELSNGMGLTNMKHRVAILGGSISVQSVPQNGTAITILIPVNHLSK